jgi:hypothetical protein
MEHSHNEVTNWHSIKKIILPKINIYRKKCIFVRVGYKKSGNWKRGTIEIEMLIWLSLISSVLGGFCKIHKYFENKHRRISEDYFHERNTL